MAFKKLGLVVGVLMMFQVSNAALSIIEMNKMSAALESMQPHPVGDEPSKVYQHHAHPEGWEAKKQSHIPTLLIKGDTAYIHVDHEQTEDHYITAIYVKGDIHGRSAQTIFFKELEPTSKKPVARFLIPDGVTQLKPYANCNKHGVWAGRRVPHNKDREL